MFAAASFQQLAVIPENIPQKTPVRFSDTDEEKSVLNLKTRFLQRKQKDGGMLIMSKRRLLHIENLAEKTCKTKWHNPF